MKVPLIAPNFRIFVNKTELKVWQISKMSSEANMEADVIVVGGGLSGLTAADCLKVKLKYAQFISFAF